MAVHAGHHKCNMCQRFFTKAVYLNQHIQAVHERHFKIAKNQRLGNISVFKPSGGQLFGAKDGN